MIVLKWMFFVLVVPVALWLCLVFSGCEPDRPQPLTENQRKGMLQISDTANVQYVHDENLNICFAVVYRRRYPAGVTQISCEAIKPYLVVPKKKASVFED